MYKIIGADGKEYGPVSVDQLKQWLTEGRVNLQTRVLSEGATDWQTLGEVPELIPPPAATTPATGAPQFSYAHMVDRDAVKSMVMGPAIAILVISILDVLTSVGGLIFGAALQDALLDMSQVPAEQIAMQKKMTMLFSLPGNIFGIVLSGICIFGSIRMMSLKSFGLAMTTAILVMIPCGTCCCFLNIGVGIWALVILNKPEVKAAFE